MPRAATARGIGGRGVVLQSVAIGSGVQGTGINRYWQYEGDALPGVGKYAVNVGTGNLLIQSDDMKVSHKGVSISFRRTYNSQSQHNYAGADGSQISNYGDGWTNTFDAHIAANSGALCAGVQTAGITVYDIDGTRYDFMPNCSGGFTPPTGQHALLKSDGGTGYYWYRMNHGGYYFYGPNQPAASAGFAGRLYRIFGRNTNTYIQFNYTWDGGDSSTPSKLQRIDVVPEYQTGATSGFAQLFFTDFSVPSCKPLHGCTATFVHRLLSSLKWPDGTLVGYNYTLNATANFAQLSWVSEPGNSSSSGSCIANQPTCAIHQYVPNSTGLIGTVLSPRAFNTTADGASVGFNYNADNSVASVQYFGVLNLTPNDGTSTPLLGSYTTSRALFRTETYARSGSTLTMSDTDGHKSTYTYDGSFRVTQTQRFLANGSALTSTSAWDANHNLIASVSPHGNASGNPAAYETDYAYDTNGNVVAIGQPQVSTTSGTFRPTELFSYDRYANMIAYCDATWSHPAHDWNVTGNPGGADNLCPSQAGVTRYIYQVLDPTTEQWGQLTSTISPLGYTRTFAYDPGPQGGTNFGMATSITGTQVTQNDGTPVTEVATFAYDAAGNTVSAGNGIGTSTYTYDTLNRALTQTDPDNVTGYQHYFPDGSVSSKETAYQHAVGRGTSYAYDVDGNTVSETHYFNDTQSQKVSVYDGMDHLVEVIQPQDPGDYYATSPKVPWLTRYIIDVSQNGMNSIATLNGVKAYGNAYKTRTYMINPPATTPAWFDTTGTSYDALDRKTASYDTTLFTTSYTGPTVTNNYDEGGTLAGEAPRTGLRSSIVNGAGERIDLHYDAQDRLVEKDTTNNAYSPQERYTYDPNGRITDAYRQNYGHETLSFDADGRPVTDQTPAVAPETSPTTVTTSYYANGWRSGLSVNSGNVGLNATNLFSYDYRSDGKLVKEIVSLNGTNQYLYTYSSSGRIQSTSDPFTSQVIPASVLRSPQGARQTVTDAVSTHPARVISPAQDELMKVLGLLRTGDPPPPAGTPLEALVAGTPVATRAAAADYVQSGQSAAIVRPRLGSSVRHTPGLKLQTAARDRRLMGGATQTSYGATTFGYDPYGRLNSKALPTGEAYTNISYDSEGEVTSFNAYGTPGGQPLNVVNSYNLRGEAVGRHYYDAGSSTYDKNWPHFASQGASGFMLPTSEDIPSGVTQYTKWYPSDDRQKSTLEYDSANNYLQGYGWLVDNANRQFLERFSDGANHLGSIQRSYDSENRLNTWSVPVTDPVGGQTMYGFPVQGPNVNIYCNQSPNVSSFYQPGTSISYQWGANGKVVRKTINNVGQVPVYEGAHYDGEGLLFTTDTAGHFDKLRVGLQGIITSSGRTIAFDRDFEGAWVMSHDATGYTSWTPPDPYLQNCVPQNAPAGSSGFTPFVMEFANITADTMTDGYNFFSGIRSYDPTSSQWTTPDPAPGTKADPASQLPFMWNRNNPMSYSDPSGFCADPSPGSGTTRVCIDFFIAARSVTSLGLLGDDRTFSGTYQRGQDPYRVNVMLDFDKQTDIIQASHTHDAYLGHDLGKGQDRGSTVTWDGDTAYIHIRNACGSCASFAPGIAADLIATREADGRVSIRGLASQFPSLEAYQYDNGGITKLLNMAEMWWPDNTHQIFPKLGWPAPNGGGNYWRSVWSGMDVFLPDFNLDSGTAVAADNGDS